MKWRRWQTKGTQLLAQLDEAPLPLRTAPQLLAEYEAEKTELRTRRRRVVKLFFCVQETASLFLGLLGVI